jgi:hypothetical protein
MIEEISSFEEIENLYKNGSNAPYRTLPNGMPFGALVSIKPEGKILCHICTKPFEFLSRHVPKHKISAQDYKEKFGFPKSYPLCSVKISEVNRQAMEKRIEALKTGGRHRPFKKGNRLYKKRKRFSAWGYLSKQNEKNSCKDQLYRQYLIVCDSLGKTASQADLKKIGEFKLKNGIMTRFGTFNKFKSEYKVGNIIPFRKPRNSDILLSQLRKFAKENNRMPKSMDFRNPTNRAKGYADASTYVNHFGSWNRAIHMAGFSRSYQHPLERLKP